MQAWASRPQAVLSADPTPIPTPWPCRIQNCYVEELNESAGSMVGFGVSSLEFRV